MKYMIAALCSLIVVIAVVGFDNVNKPNSWEMYCEKYGVSVNNPSDSQLDYYLDCYVGSVEEENDNLIRK